MKVTGVTAGLAESNGSLLPGLWRDSLHVTCGLTACTQGSAPGPTLGNEYGKTLPFNFTFNSFRVRFDKLLPYILFEKYTYIFGIGNGQSREPALCQLYRHT